MSITHITAHRCSGRRINGCTTPIVQSKFWQISFGAHNWTTIVTFKKHVPHLWSYHLYSGLFTDDRGKLGNSFNYWKIRRKEQCLPFGTTIQLTFFDQSVFPRISPHRSYNFYERILSRVTTNRKESLQEWKAWQVLQKRSEMSK